jgi:hypothetical protein
LASSIRALIVRVAGFTSGRIALTLPLNIVPGTAGARASTGLPGRTCAAKPSGTSAFTQTVDRPLMRNRGAPAITVIPSRAVSSPTTPPIGAVIVTRACTFPPASTAAICASLIPARRIRCLAASASPARLAASDRAPIRFADKYSSCAATQSGM